ncbi:MAG: CDP-alcohol phosphatidyltransferase family protein [Candidatus Aminicenantes bacterium]|nr:CDP-alcohol phosphatidyltransferase family protein [Candidatus Aminicenantes bacterium]
MNEAVKGPVRTAGRERRSDVLTLPNLLSLSRILLTPVFVWMMIQKRPWAAFIVFLAAGATDALDGFAARMLHLRSTLGLWLDPAGDKVLLTSAFVVLTLPALAQPNTLPLWLTGICVGRDVVIALAALVLIALRGKQTFTPVLAGKASTVCQVLVLYFVLYSNAVDRSPQALAWLYVLTALLTCISWIQYGFRGIALLRGRRKNAS